MSEAADEQATASEEETPATDAPAEGAPADAATPTVPAAQEPAELQDPEFLSDMDSLHILPLSIVPFETDGLKRAKLIKNVRFETVIEMFKDESTGSGQIKIEDVGKMFGWPEGEVHPDQQKLARLAGLPACRVTTSIRSASSFATSASRSTISTPSGFRRTRTRNSLNICGISPVP
jgi:3-oxoacyl-ACP reductase-like protein